MTLPLSLTTDNRATDLLAVGENSLDVLAVVEGHPRANDKMPLLDLRELPGGEAATAAVGVARLGWRSKYIGRFGDDRFGRLCREQLVKEGVDLSDAITVDDTPNRSAVILVDRQTGNRTVLWQRDARLHLQAGDIRDEALMTCRLLLVGSDDVAAMTSAAQRARTFDVRTVGDLEHVHPGTDALLRHLDVVVMASTFARALTGVDGPGAGLRKVAALTTAPFLCVTLGEDGCLALVDGHEIHVPAVAVEVRDTTGAGDLFRAGLMARWLAQPHNPSILELLRYANAVAALNCREVGAQTAAPRPEEVVALLDR